MKNNLLSENERIEKKIREAIDIMKNNKFTRFKIQDENNDFECIIKIKKIKIDKWASNKPKMNKLRGK